MAVPSNERTYPRVNVPEEMQLQFSFHGDRYNLSFPKLTDFDSGELGDFIENTDPRNLYGLIEQMAAWIKTCASGYRLVIFKDIKPSTVEEKVLAQTGKTLYFPSTRESLPQEDPYPRKRIITEELFKNYLESTGVGSAFAGTACARFVKSKADSGILSDIWTPILFQEYVIGYIHIWNIDSDKELFNYSIVDTLYQFSKVLAHSMEINGFFSDDKLKRNPFEGKIVDISASGLLFACPQSDFLSSLLPGSHLVVSIITPQRTVFLDASIVRRFNDPFHGYIGCRFLDVPTDEFGFLFECIYGKPLTDFDAGFITGQA